MDDRTDSSSRQSQGGGSRTMGGFLASALDMEDQLSKGVYAHYIQRSNWPGGMSDDAFEEIRKRLKILLDDTEKHKKILQALIKKQGDAAQGR